MPLQLQNRHPQQKQPYVTGKAFEDATALVSRVIPITLDLFHTKQSLPFLKFQDRFLDSKSKQKRSLEDDQQETMSRRSGGAQKLDLRLNLSSPPPPPRDESPTSRSASVSPPSSCMSSEEEGGGGTSGSSMVLVGCPRCLLYVMLSENDPKCPKCKSTVLLDFLRNNNDTSHCGSSKKTRKN